MKRRSLARATLAAAVSIGALLGAATLTPAFAAPGGSGPHPADYVTAQSLPNHTIYRPATLPAEDMPIVVWGNGACSADGTSSQNFLREIASHGFLVIANGNPGGSGTSNAQMLTASIDWAVAENARSGSSFYNRLDTSEIGVAGFSCGGLEAYEVSSDPRVTTTGIFSSGLLDDGNDYQLRALDHPIAYIIGGPSDIAYPNAIDDWSKLPAGLPAFMGNLDVGHGGTYHETNGGEFGRVATLWFQWQLKGDTQAGRTFVGSDCGLCQNQAWDVQQKNLTLGTNPDPGPEPDPDPEPTPDPVPGTSACTATYTIESQWNGGFVANVTVKATSAVSGWSTRVALPSGASVNNAWGGTPTSSNGAVTFSNAGWNGTLGAGQSTSFGFVGTGNGAGATVSCTAS